MSEYPTAPEIAKDLPRGFRQSMLRLIRDARTLESDVVGKVGRWHDRTYAAVDRGFQSLPVAACSESYAAQKAMVARMDAVAGEVREFGRAAVAANDAARLERLREAAREAARVAREAAYARRDPFAPLYR